MNKRAVTEEQKREIIERLYMVWLKEPEWRLSQLIWNTFQGSDFFYVEDKAFIEYLEKSHETNED